jgi:hypothetical protein
MITTFTLLNIMDAETVITLLNNNGHSSQLRGDGFIEVTHNNYDFVRALINNYIPHQSVEELALIELKNMTETGAVTDCANLPAWVKTGTAADAETYINSQIWSGQTQAQIETWIDANITNVTTANVSQINAKLASIRAGLKLAAVAIVSMRSLFILTSKLLIYIRDLVIRFR